VFSFSSQFFSSDRSIEIFEEYNKDDDNTNTNIKEHHYILHHHTSHPT